MNYCRNKMPDIQVILPGISKTDRNLYIEIFRLILQYKSPFVKHFQQVLSIYQQRESLTAQASHNYSLKFTP